MTQFILYDAHEPAFQALDSFTQAYIQAAYFTEEERLREELGEHRDPNFTDLAPETLAAIIADCAKFLKDNEHLIKLGARPLSDDIADEMVFAGHDFWLTRNGHGAGFWDGDWPEPYATQLDNSAKAFGECSLYVGDDQLIYIS